MPAPATWSRSRSTAWRSARRRTRCWSTPPSTATSRSRSSATSPSSASRSAPAACAWSRSRASRSCRPVLDAGQGRHGRPHPDRARARRAARGGRVPAHQPPARLPGLRQGRRVPAAGHHLRLGPGHVALHRAQAPLQEAARAVAADRDRPRALHPLLPLRALLAGDLRGLPADPARARRALVRRHVRRPPVRGAVQRQHHRAVPGRRAHLARTASARARGTSRARARLHALPGAVQRRADRARRARDARARARPRRGRRRLAVRPRAASPTRPCTSTSGSSSRWCARAPS